MARMLHRCLPCDPRAAGHRWRVLCSLAFGVSNFRRRVATTVAKAAVAACTLFLTALASHAATLPPSLTASFIPRSISVFGNATLDFTISNPNATALSGVSFTDVLPSGLAVQSLNVSQCSFTVTATVGGSVISVAPAAALLANENCQVTVTVVSSKTGTFTTTTSAITSNEGGNGNAASASLTVTTAPTATSVSSNPNPSRFGQLVTFMVTVSPTSGAPGQPIPTGTVTISVAGNPVASGTLVGGQTTITTTALPVGNLTITATYSGDTNFSGSSSSAPFTVLTASTSTAVTSSQNPSTSGQSVTFTATVTAVAPGAGTPTGTVTFLDGGTSIGTGMLSGGVATFATSTLAVGNHTITTTYNGDGNFSGSTGSLTGNPQVVTKAPATATNTTVTSSQNPSVFGQSVTFSATVSPVAPATGTPTGTVTFLDGGTPIGTGTLSGGVATFMTTTLAAGNHTITANYSSDSTFASSTGSLNTNPQVVNKANTNTTVTSSANPSVFGQSVTFTANVSAVSPGAGTPTGTVTFLDGGNTIGSGTLSGGVATIATSTLAVGNHTITTTYNGDGNFNGSNGSLTGNPQVVNKTPATNTTVTSSQNPSVFGQSVTFTATVSPVAPATGTPTGTVTFLDGGTSIGTGMLSGGIATFTTSTLTVGSHTITTSYNGDNNFLGSNGSLTGNPQVVNKATPTITFISSQNPSSFNQSVTFTAAVTAPNGGTPTGSVTFTDTTLGQTLGTGSLANGQASVTTTTLAVGMHNIQASYSGDGGFNTVSNTLTQSVTASTLTTVQSSQQPSTLGQSVTFTAMVSISGGTPTGTVTFSVDGGAGTAAPLSGGKATFTTSTLALGMHTITATYATNGGFLTSTGSFSQTVNPLAATTTTVTSSGSPSTLGQSVTFTATVAPASPNGLTPTGSVTFTDQTTNQTLGTVTLSLGVAKLAISSLAAGSHTILASYSGDNTFSVSSGSITQTVNKLTPTATLSSSPGTPSTFNQTVTFTLTLTGVGGFTPTGMAKFTDQSTNQTLATVSVGGSGGVVTAAFSISTLSAGTHIVVATYNGDNNFNGNTASFTQTVDKANTSTGLISSQNPSSFTQAVTFTATISGADGGTPTGSVTFTDTTFSQTLGTVQLSNGQATITVATLSTGTHHIQASYGGDNNFISSSTALDQVVTAATTTTVKSSLNPSNAGQLVTFTATVAGAGAFPTGTVTFSVDSGPGTSVTLNGAQAVFITSTLTAGQHTITANFVGAAGSGFLNSTGSVMQTVNKDGTTISIQTLINPSAFGQLATFTAVVTVPSGGAGTATGTVNFTVDAGSPISATLSAVNATLSSASFSTTTLSLGQHTITAIYLGDNNFTGSGPTSLTQNVQQSPTETLLTAAPNPATVGQAVKFTATVTPIPGSGAPTGTVTFKDNGTTIGTGTLAAVGNIRQATFTTSALTLGSHTITAVYSGDADFIGSTSPPLIEVIGTPADSIKLRELQVSATPIIAQAWAQSVTAAMDDAVSAGFGGNPQALSPAGTGFTYYFTDDAPARPDDDADADSLRRYLTSPNGSLTSPNGSANSAAANTVANDSVKRVDDDFSALGYAGGMPTKAPPPVQSSAPRDWLAWINVRGTDFYRGTFGNDLKGEQVDAIAGLTRRISPNFVVGVFGGYEHFDYSSQAFNGVLKGDGWTTGAYLGWKLSPNIRFDAGGAWSDLLASDVSGTAAGNFLGTRWLVNGGLTLSVAAIRARAFGARVRAVGA
jgi:large repetitive protein